MSLFEKKLNSNNLLQALYEQDGFEASPLLSSLHIACSFANNSTYEADIWLIMMKQLNDEREAFGKPRLLYNGKVV